MTWPTRIALFQRPTSINAWMLGSLEEVRVVDPRTVDFVLSAVDATFMTEVLPSVPILPRHAVEAAYADFVAATKDLTAADLSKLADTIEEEVGRDPPVCETRLDEVASLLTTIGARLYREDFSRETGRLRARAPTWTRRAWFIRQAATALETAADPDAAALDAVAAAFQLLSTDWEPIGTGPYRFVSEDADGVHLEAWPGYHGGLAATRYVDFVPAKADGSDLVAGTVDILQWPTVDAAYRATAASRGVRFATLISGGFLGLQINVRPGRLFADRQPPPGAPAVHRPPARRRRRDGWRQCPGLRPGPARAAGRTIPTCRSRPATRPRRSGSSRAQAGSSGRTASTRRTGSASPPRSWSGGTWPTGA